MDDFCKGQCVRIKSADDIASEYGYSIGDFQDGDIVIGEIRIHPSMTELFGHIFIARDVDYFDHSVYITAGDDSVDCDYWWPFELLEPAEEPDELFGFHVGDRVEFRDYSEIQQSTNWFDEGMKYLCGTTGTITKISPDGLTYAAIEMIDDKGEQIGWLLNTKMVDHIDTSPDVEVDDWFSVINIT